MRTTLKSTPSTQLVIKEYLSQGKKLSHLDCVIADEQTEGRGRQGRSWVSESGNLTASIYISEYSYPPTWVPLWISVVVLESLRDFEVPGSRLSVKWPNDILIDEKNKISGILCEKVDSGIIAGVGVNLSYSPKEILGTTSLNEVLGKEVSSKTREQFLDKIIARLKNAPSFEELKKLYSSYALLKAGDEISWVEPATQNAGTGSLIRYGELGELVVKDQSGKERALYSEEVHLIKRP